ncbi:Lactosylceramide 4-alpha-galactosyltransferase [Bertholletia excelsa]
MFHSRLVGRVKLSIYSAISFAVVLSIIIVLNNSISNLSLQSITVDGPPHDTRQNLRSGSGHQLLLYVKEEVKDHTHILANVTGKKRIQKLKPTNRERGFHVRVTEFLGGHRCSVQFFMTWISPASLFGPREFLAVESLFKAHPRGCLVIISETMDSAPGYTRLKPLLDHRFRLLPVTPDLPFLFKNTPAESWFDEIKKGKKDAGTIPLAQNLSNLIRFAVLYKYGGVYLDTDFIILKDLFGLRNSIGAQSVDSSGNWTRLNNAVLIFDKNHPLLYLFMEEFASTFNGYRWGHNGPYLVSRVVGRVSAGHNCNFTVLPPMAFYPVSWTRIGRLFGKPDSRAGSKWVEAKLVQLNRRSYGVHLWNRMSSGLKIEEGSAMGRLFSTHCVICKRIYSS